MEYVNINEMQIKSSHFHATNKQMFLQHTTMYTSRKYMIEIDAWMTITVTYVMRNSNFKTFFQFWKGKLHELVNSLRPRDAYVRQ